MSLDIDKVTVRLMEEADVEAASVIESAVFSIPWKASDFLEMVKAPYAYYFVAICDEKVVGILGLRDIAGEGEITNVAVDESKRGCGIASKMLEKAFEQCTLLNIKDITLEVRVSNIPAISLYEKYGFESDGIRPGFYDHPKEDALIMWRRS